MADQIGENLKAEVKGNTLTLTIDLTKTLRKSKSGKNDLVATTGGNVAIGGIKLGLNAYK